MKIILKILKWILISIVGVIACIFIGIFIYNNFFYEREMNQIKKMLNEIENVEVVNIWGHKDITLEEIAVRLRIKNKGEIVLNDLSKDVFRYPQSVHIAEIGGYSFTHFTSKGEIVTCIDIGTKGELGKLINFKFNSAEEVIRNYDNILNLIKGLKIYPETNHFETSNTESYLLVENKSSKDQDPLFNLFGMDNKFKYAHTLKWNRSDSFYNRNSD